MNSIIIARILRDAALILSLAYISYVDAKRFEVPDKALLTALVAWLATAPLLAEESAPGHWFLQHLLSGLAVGAALLFFSLLLDRLLKKETLGGGDIKLFAVLGLYTGWFGAYLTVLLSCIFGLLLAAWLLPYRRKHPRKGPAEAHTGPDDEKSPTADPAGISPTAIPFAPAISLAGLIALYMGDQIYRTYINWMHLTGIG